MQLPLDVATPLALIVNEVVSNAFKHAFADGRRGEIVVTLDETAEHICLEIRDDGFGIRPGRQPRPSRSRWALRLIELLAGQIGGKVSWSSNGGTMFSLVLPRQ